MIIKNGLVFWDNTNFIRKDLYIQNGRIVSDPEQVTDDTILDAEGLYVLPGLIDIHSHGAMGCDFSDNDPAGLQKILAYEYAHGITSYCPTSMSLEREKLLELFASQGEILKNLPDRNPASCNLSHVPGFHMEGPFLDIKKRGAHRAECLVLPDVSFFRACNAACDYKILLVTIAPELDGATHFIEELSAETILSLGHTSADHVTAERAIKKGATHVTHLFNAMMPLNHREPGLIGATAEDPNCYAELICDGIHIHESAVRAAFKLFPNRIVLVSDSMRATGMPDGTYDLGGQQVHVKGSLASLSDGTIAGSVTNLYDCMRRAVSFGIPLEDAVSAASANPAKSIGIYDKVGSLTPGKQADILLTDKDLHLVNVLS